MGEEEFKKLESGEDLESLAEGDVIQVASWYEQGGGRSNQYTPRNVVVYRNFRDKQLLNLVGKNYNSDIITWASIFYQGAQVNQQGELVFSSYCLDYIKPQGMDFDFNLLGRAEIYEQARDMLKEKGIWDQKIVVVKRK